MSENNLASDIPEGEYRIVVFRDQTPKLHAKVLQESGQEYVLRMGSSPNIQGFGTFIEEIALPTYGIFLHFKELMEFDEKICQGLIRRTIEIVFLMGIEFQKGRKNENGDKDREGW